MRKISKGSILLLSIILLQTGCHKPGDDVYGIPKVPREFRFQLYTNSDFSKDNHIITFEAFIENSAYRVLWDSILPPMKIKDIPDSMHKLIINKSIPGNETGLLKAGFRYAIENVGNSSYYDSSKASQTIKVIDFDFH
jgi:hypothetical protein